MYMFKSRLGQLTFSLKRRESEPSQLVLLCCLAWFDDDLPLHVYSSLSTAGQGLPFAYAMYNVHVNSVSETRQSKATTPEDNFFFLKRKNEQDSNL